jgi:hypothetical protein
MLGANSVFDLSWQIADSTSVILLSRRVKT